MVNVLISAPMELSFLEQHAYLVMQVVTLAMETLQSAHNATWTKFSTIINVMPLALLELTTSVCLVGNATPVVPHALRLRLNVYLVLLANFYTQLSVLMHALKELKL